MTDKKRTFAVVVAVLVVCAGVAAGLCAATLGSGAAAPARSSTVALGGAAFRLQSAAEEASRGAGAAGETVFLVAAAALGLFAAVLLLLFANDSRRRRKARAVSDLKEAVLDNMPCGAGVYRYDGERPRIIYLNRRYMELVGRSGERIETEDVTKVIHPDDVAGMNAELRAAIAEKRDAVCELRLLLGDGSYAPFRIIGHVSAEKDAAKVYCLYFPIEDGVFKAVRERQDMEARYRNLVDNAGGGLTVTEKSADGRLTNIFTSEGLLRMLRMDRRRFAELTAGDVYAKVHPDDIDAARGIFDALEEDGDSVSAAFRLLCGDGGYAWVSVAGRLAVENGKRHIYAVHTDISMQKAIEQNVRSASEQLGFLNRIAGELLAETDADAAINTVLKEILKHFAGTRSYVFEFDTDKELAHNTYEVCAPGVESAMELLETVPFGSFSEWFSLFEKHGYIAITDTAALGDDRMAERELLVEQGISSLAAVPLRIDGRLIGMLGVDDPARNADQMSRLQAIGDYMSVMLLRRNMADELSESNRTMTVMMGDTPGGFAQMLIHPDSSITPSFINDGFCRMLSMTRDETMEMFGSDAYGGLHPDDMARVSALIGSTIAARSTLTTRLRFITGDGSYIPVEAYYRVWDASGGLFLNGYYRDISDKVELEENYKRNLAYRDLTCRNAIGSFHLNVTRNTVDDGVSNEPAIFALAADGTLDGFVSNLIGHLGDELERSQFTGRFSRAALRDAISQGRTQITMEHSFAAAWDDDPWVRTTVDLFRNPDSGDIEGFIYGMDASEQHTLSLLMNTVVSVGYDFIVAINAVGGSYRTFLSDAGAATAYRETGVYNDDTVNDLMEILHPDDREDIREAMRLPSILRALDSEGGRFELRYRVLYGGDVHYKKTTYTFIDKAHLHIVACRTDETNTVLAMQAALDAAEKANAAKSDFLSHMSHEIRTPMNAIIGMTELARESADMKPEAVNEYT